MVKIRFNYLSAVALIVVLMFSCGKKEEVRQELIRPVRYMQAYSTGGARVRIFSGITQAGLESNLSFKVPGTVKRIAVKVGDEVRVGRLLAQLDPGDYELQVQQAEAALANAQAQARNAEANYNRIRALYENNSASRTDLDASRAADESADAAVRSAEKQLELARLQLGYTILKAPTSGAISRVDAEVNENLESGKTVVVLTAGTEMEVKVSRGAARIPVAWLERNDWKSSVSKNSSARGRVSGIPMTPSPSRAVRKPVRRSRRRVPAAEPARGKTEPWV